MTVKNPRNGLTYDDLFAKLVEKEGLERVFVGNHTYVEWLRDDYIGNYSNDEGFIAMTFHDTKVVNFLDSETVQLFDGGYMTKSTASRLDWALLPLGYRCATRNEPGTGRVRWGESYAKFKIYSIKTGIYHDYIEGMIVERGAF